MICQRIYERLSRIKKIALRPCRAGQRPEGVLRVKSQFDVATFTFKWQDKPNVFFTFGLSSLKANRNVEQPPRPRHHPLGESVRI